MVNIMSFLYHLDGIVQMHLANAHGKDFVPPIRVNYCCGWMEEQRRRTDGTGRAELVVGGVECLHFQ